MDGTDAIGALLDGGVLERNSAGLERSATYESTVREWRERLRETDDAAVSEQLRELDVDHVDHMVDLAGTGSSVVAEVAAIAALTSIDSLDHLSRLAIAVRALRDGSEPDSGVPEGFLPVAGDDLSTCLRLMKTSIVYVWREECEPCDAVKAEYQAIRREIPDDVARFAVYGPPAARRLDREFDVQGAPVSLFCRRNAVDVRLTGEHGRQAILQEVQRLLTATDRP